MRRLLLCLSLFAAAQSKPDFTGTWRLNLAASDYSDPSAAPPDQITVVIKQKGDHFEYQWEHRARGKTNRFEVDATAGGAPYESDAAGVVSLEWKGESLIVSTLYNPGQDRQSDQAEVWTLSPDHKRLTEDLTVHPLKHGAPVHVVRVFDKQ